MQARPQTAATQSVSHELADRDVSNDVTEHPSQRLLTFRPQSISARPNRRRCSPSWAVEGLTTYGKGLERGWRLGLVGAGVGR